MKYKSIKVNTVEKEVFIRDYALFSWNLDKEIVQGIKTILCFSRDEQIEHLKEIKKLEKEYFSNSKKVSLPIIIIVCAIVLVYLSVMAGLIISGVLKFDSITKILVLVLPSSLTLILLTYYTFYNSKKMMISSCENDKYSVFEKKIKNLKE